MSTNSAIEIVPLLANRDNCMYLIAGEGRALVVDPADASLVRRECESRRCELRAILLTHGHSDHTSGVSALRDHFGCPVRSFETCTWNPDSLTGLPAAQETLAGWHVQMLHVPGHTQDSIAFYCEVPQALFCGDTLFTMGCGRVFGGQPHHLYDSLCGLARLPAGTRVYGGHDYTRENLRFALHILPHDPEILRRKHSIEIRRKDFPGIPSTLGKELRTNIFLRAKEPSVKEAAGMKDARAKSVFMHLRKLKDRF